MDLILTIDPSEDMARVLKRLEATEVQVTRVLDKLHVVAVRCEGASVQQIRAIPGVVSAEPEAVVTLDPREVPELGAPPPSLPNDIGNSWRSPAWRRDND